MLEEKDKALFVILVIIGFTILIPSLWYVGKFIKLGGFEGEHRLVYNRGQERFIDWEVRETIDVSYEKCKDINRSKLIKRLINRDYRLPMCPQSYVVLYDESQKMVFVFNRENEKFENPQILTISTSCDNSSGIC